MNNFLQYLREMAMQFHYSERNLFYLGTAVVLGIVLRYILYFSLRLFIWRTDNFMAKSLRKRLNGIFFILLPAFFILFFMPLIRGNADFKFFLQRAVQIVFIISFAWLLAKLAFVAEDVLFKNLDISKSDNFYERKMRTQIQFIKRLVVTIIVILAIALVFMRFEGMRRIGASILASAGILGVILGFAAQRSLANFLAGLQIAFTQPIRIDDVVIVEGEWGRIEEITLTYVVVKIWDLRRMVLPITYFIEKPFQNWTRRTADILGSAMIYVDYSVPVEEVRNELFRIVKSSHLWDEQVCELAVTNLSEKTMELRALISARNSGDAFDLRCLIREKLIAFIREKYPQSLPKFRAEVLEVKVGNE